MEKVKEWTRTDKENIAFDKYEKEIETRYPISYQAFLSSQRDQENFLKRIERFFIQHGLRLYCDISTSPKYGETYTVTVDIFRESTLKKLRKNTRTFKYSYCVSYESGVRKGLFQGFKIINNLILGIPMTETTRRRR